MEERLQKIMAHAGLGSRRDCEALIIDGRVRVNGNVAVIGAKADPTRDHITIDGNPLHRPETLVYIALYKPRGVLSTVEAPDPRRTVRELVPVSGTLYPVGRLDVDSEGLILLTNDGELANRLTHPRYGHEKEYRVLVARQPDDQQIAAWVHGVVLEDGYRTAPAEVEIESKLGRGAWLRVILKEGRKRQIREMGMRTGLPVVRIIRVRIGTLGLGTLKPGEWRTISPREVVELKNPEASSARQRVAARAISLNKMHSKAPRPPERRPARSVNRAGKPAGDQPDNSDRGRRPARTGPGKPSHGPRSQGTGSERAGSPDRDRPSNRPASRPGPRPPRSQKPTQPGSRGPAGRRPPRRSPHE